MSADSSNGDNAGQAAAIAKLLAMHASAAAAPDIELRVSSPCMGIEPEVYKWPLRPIDEFDPATDLLNTIRLVARDFQPEGMPDYTYTVNTVKRTDLAAMTRLLDTFNAEVERLKPIRHARLERERQLEPDGPMNPSSSTASQSTPATASYSRLPFDLVSHIMTQVYNRVITDPRTLNGYKGFSAEVYGEVNFEMIHCLVEKVPITKDDIFIDLGSGVGQAVLQVALQTGCRTYGIEKRDICANGPFELAHGDFLEDEVRPRIKGATIIFVNNYVFDPQLNLSLRQRFEELLEHGAKIVSSSAFAPLEKVKLTSRNVGSLESVMRVRCIRYGGQGVSWTNKSVPFFVHRVDYTRLWRFLQKQSASAGATSRSTRSRGETSRRRSGRYDVDSEDQQELQDDSTSSPETDDDDIVVADYGHTGVKSLNLSPFFSGGRRHRQPSRSTPGSSTSSPRPTRPSSPSYPSSGSRGQRPSRKSISMNVSPLPNFAPSPSPQTASPPSSRHDSRSRHRRRQRQRQERQAQLQREDDHRSDDFSRAVPTSPVLRAAPRLPDFVPLGFEDTLNANVEDLTDEMLEAMALYCPLSDEAPPVSNFEQDRDLMQYIEQLSDPNTSDAAYSFQAAGALATLVQHTYLKAFKMIASLGSPGELLELRAQLEREKEALNVCKDAQQRLSSESQLLTLQISALLRDRGLDVSFDSPTAAVDLVHNIARVSSHGSPATSQSLFAQPRTMPMKTD
ncbi:hypothetical protein CAOG_05674 [Capsaspora owczarzaki ATCC 30864]|uniref:Histone-lysine N-methyltransferase, H3 lysine-79 specific n=1 Tax=Capsaspora owczarzaki (strain ATCC 30864) TaxID=595528 RepID=A0A0D2UJD8_CAPO3|nr:hypothetical protein CAOG_05674 [Capsaspora owczarzaki ATCC 30864]KJE95196.1 hypothetical protein CAOG_005674 [Capsaspora owczarzaki ATCC 30864]|eukprot:XP_004346347.2 hypothetical protein CAOG_05674 [Capsaspora owczarzaki ATCC 30864]